MVVNPGAPGLGGHSDRVTLILVCSWAVIPRAADSGGYDDVVACGLMPKNVVIPLVIDPRSSRAKNRVMR